MNCINIRHSTCSQSKVCPASLEGDQTLYHRYTTDSFIRIGAFLCSLTEDQITAFYSDFFVVLVKSCRLNWLLELAVWDSEEGMDLLTGKRHARLLADVEHNDDLLFLLCHILHLGFARKVTLVRALLSHKNILTLNCSLKEEKQWVANHAGESLNLHARVQEAASTCAFRPNLYCFG